MHLGAAPPELELGGGDPSSRASRRGTPAVISLAATPSSLASRLGSSSTSPRGAPRCEIGGHDPLHLVPPGVGVLQPSGASPPRRAPARHLPGEPIAAPPRRAAAQRTVVLPMAVTRKWSFCGHEELQRIRIRSERVQSADAKIKLSERVHLEKNRSKTYAGFLLFLFPFRGASNIIFSQLRFFFNSFRMSFRI